MTDSLTTETRFHRLASPLRLQSGEEFDPVDIAYETYGTLNADRSNAVLLFHALTGSQHAAGFNPAVPGVGGKWNGECQTGWWDEFVGPGKALDTDRFFVVCANYFGGCYGTTGPASRNPQTGRPYGGAFPKFGVSDMVDAQVRLVREVFGIETLHAAIGASLGGLLNINLAVRYPDLCSRFLHIGSGLEVSTLTRAHNFEQIMAIEYDRNFNNGDYYDGEPPNGGLCLARMISHKTYVSLHAIEARARDELVQNDSELTWYQVRRSIESYLLHQAQKLPKRFDPNTYLHLMAAWSDFDLLRDTGRADYAELFAPCRHQRHYIVSIDSDVCFYPDEQEFLCRQLSATGVAAECQTVHSENGHDAFLLEPETFGPHLVIALTSNP